MDDRSDVRYRLPTVAAERFEANAKTNAVLRVTFLSWLIKFARLDPAKRENGLTRSRKSL